MTDDSFGAFRADEIGSSADTDGGVSPPCSSRTPNYPAGNRVTGVSEAARATANASNARCDAVPCQQPAGDFGRAFLWGDHSCRWTEARDARIKQGWESGEASADILAAVNALPGLKISSTLGIKDRAFRQNWRRPKGWVLTQANMARRAVSPWTPERDAYLRAAYERGDRLADILAGLNAIPAAQPVPSVVALSRYALEHGLRRSADYGPKLAAKFKAEHGPWNPARCARLTELWQRGDLTAPQIAAEINALPGSRDVTANACQRKAWAMKIGGRRPGRKTSTEAAPPVEQRPRKAPAEPVVERKQVLGTSRTYTFGTPAAAPEPDAPPPEYDAARASSMESRVERARMMLRRRAEPTTVAAVCRLPLWRVFALVGEIRQARR